jgi:hypothetical protein
VTSGEAVLGVMGPRSRELLRLGPGDTLIAEDLTGQGHVTREVGPEARVSIFVPLG